MDLSGATVTVWTDATKATQLDTQVTNGSGVAVLDVGTAGTHYYEVTYPTRLATSSASALMSCGTTRTVNLTPATDYFCLSWCVLPLYKTVFATFSSVLPTITLHHSGGGWSGGLNYAYPGCGGCPAATVPLFIDFSNLQVGPNLGFPGCPGNGVSPAVLPLTTISQACPPSFSWAQSLPSSAPYLTFEGNLFCGPTATVTFTE